MKNTMLYKFMRTVTAKVYDQYENFTGEKSESQTEVENTEVKPPKVRTNLDVAKCNAEFAVGKAIPQQVMVTWDGGSMYVEFGGEYFDWLLRKELSKLTRVKTTTHEYGSFYRNETEVEAYKNAVYFILLNKGYNTEFTYEENK